MTNPYREQPDRAFWSRSIPDKFKSRDLYDGNFPLIRRDDRIASAGSCFAANVIAPLEAAGFHYERTELFPYPLSTLPENLGYGKFSARYGNIYTARQFRQLLERADGGFVPQENLWIIDGKYIDPFRPGLRYPALAWDEFQELQAAHLRAVKAAFTNASLTIFTLGLTEAWISAADGAVFPTCPGTVGGLFDPERHRFVNFSVQDVVNDLTQAFWTIRGWNPQARIIVTVSPVPLVATATKQHVVSATIRSKSVLRAAADEVASLDFVEYFPAYEIITGPQASHDFFQADRREVSDAGIAAVMDALLAHCETTQQPTQLSASGSSTLSRADISRSISNAECDEVMLEW